MMSQEYVASQYASIETPLMSCWCFALTSASLTMKTANEAGMKEKATTMKRTATNERNELMMVPCRRVNGSGALMTEMLLLTPPVAQL